LIGTEKELGPASILQFWKTEYEVSLPAPLASVRKEERERSETKNVLSVLL
jgi:hypothetical protein